MTTKKKAAKPKAKRKAGPVVRMQTWQDLLHELKTGQHRATGMEGRATD